MPVQLGSLAWPCRYSSATRPTAAALTRSGMSLVTSVTSRPSAARAQRHGEDPGVVGVGAEAGRQHRRVGVVELDPHRAAVVVDRQRQVQPTVLDPQVVEDPQRLPGEHADLRMVALALQLGDDHQRQDHLVLGEPENRPRVGQQHRGVQDVGPAGDRVRSSLGGRRRDAGPCGAAWPALRSGPLGLAWPGWDCGLVGERQRGLVLVTGLLRRTRTSASAVRNVRRPVRGRVPAPCLSGLGWPGSPRPQADANRNVPARARCRGRSVS